MNFLKYIWPVLLGIYIISPFDAHPLFFDDLIAAAVLFYVIYKNTKIRGSAAGLTNTAALTPDSIRRMNRPPDKAAA
jgi:hypothetical protein